MAYPKTLTHPAAILLMGATLSACGGAGSGDPTDDPVRPTNPTISAADVRSAYSLIDSIRARRSTPGTTILPTGTASYSGKALTDLTIDGYDDVDGLVGDIQLTADLFLSGDDVSGTITNIHTLDGQTPIERLGGTLTISGSLNDGDKRMNAALSGELDGVLGGDERGTVTVTGSMSGLTQDTRTGTVPLIGTPIYDIATGIAGGISGDFSGDATGAFDGDWAVSE